MWRREEQIREVRELSHEEAMQVLEAARGELERRGAGAAVAVVDTHGELVAFLRTDGCRLSSVGIAVNKAYTAAREQVPSAEVGRRARDEGFPMTNFGEMRYVTWGGGIPLLLDGSFLGAVGVSGLPEDEDVEVAAAAAAVLSA